MIRWTKQLLIAIDQLGNVLLSPLLNLFVQRGGAAFGSPDETLSSVMGKNARAQTCPLCRWICRNILNPIQRHHCDKSIEPDEGMTK